MMKRFHFPMTFGVFLLGSALLAGCGKTEEQPAKTEKTPAAEPGEDKHDHPSEGPHKGSLIELGKEGYHAELVHPEHTATGEVTVYILDGSAKKQVPIDAKTVTMNIQHEGKPEQFTLDAVPDKGDPEGQSSRFTSKDAGLLRHFEGNVHGKLVLKIEDKSYSGDIDHHHK